LDPHRKSGSLLSRLWSSVREHISQAAIGGAIVALTGFAPEHWFAATLKAIYIPEWMLNAWPSSVDARLAIVSLGIAIIVGDVLWRRRASDRPRLLTSESHRISEGGELDRSLTLPDKPSIAVLPFANLSGDLEQEYFADGVVEDIITALSRVKWFFVIARNSSFTYKGKNADVKQVARELGVRYVLEGSVRKAGNKVRITAQVIDGTNGTHVWADSFDGALEDIFDLQDRITASVVTAVQPNLQLAEFERLKQKPPANFDAYDLALRAQQHWYEFTEEGFAAALVCLKKALTIDPAYAPAMAMIAYCLSYRRLQGWAKDVAELTEGLRLASRAIELAKDDSQVLWMAAFAVLHLAMDRQRARELIDRSLLLNPNSAPALTVAANLETYSGDQAKALELLRRAERLNPRDPRIWFRTQGMAVAHFMEGRFDEAASYAQKALAQNPRFGPALRILAASLAKLGRRDKAAEAVREMLKLEPQLTISKIRARSMFVDENVWNKIADGLRLAGLSE
jgi:TolB-like protein/Tfp pilus assembly protein PilF